MSFTSNELINVAEGPRQRQRQRKSDPAAAIGGKRSIITFDAGDDDCTTRTYSSESEIRTSMADPMSLCINLKSCMAVKPRNRDGSSFARKKRVSFGKIQIRDMWIILGDSPCTSAGPPISLGWEYDPGDEFQLDIDSYEDYRDRSGTRRLKVELRIPPKVRVNMLLQAGYSPKEIESAGVTRRNHPPFHFISHMMSYSKGRSVSVSGMVSSVCQDQENDPDNSIDQSTWKGAHRSKRYTLDLME